MKRRQFITLFGGAAAWPQVARAQQPPLPVIGFLGSASPQRWASRMRAFHQGLAEAGYVAGRNVAIEYRWAEDQNDRMAALAADLVARQVDVIAVLGSAPATMAAKAATGSIPIIFQLAGDPVELGLVASLSRPGGNLTGVTSLNMEVAPKQLQLLHELVPSATVVGLLVNEANPLAEPAARSLQAVGNTLGLRMPVLHASDERDLDAVFQKLVQHRAGGLVIAPSFTGRFEQLGALTSRHAVPAISPYREFAAAGGLMSYGTDIADLYREAGVYTGRILKGAKPADLPVQQATKVQLVINLKTAAKLGVNIPLPLVGRADEVIE